MQATREQVIAAFEAVVALGNVIREHKSIPSGELYARVADKVDLRTYQKMIDTLKRAGVVKESAHLLTWVEPTETVKL